MPNNRPKKRWKLCFSATGFLALCILVQPIAAEGTARGRDQNEPVPPHFAIGLVVGSTVTPDYPNGHIGTFMLVDSAGVRPPYSHSSYSRSAAERPIFGTFIETKLPSRLSLQATVLFRELTYDWEVIYTDPAGRVFLPDDLDPRLANSGSTALYIWEIPLTVRYQFPPLRGKTSGIRPFIGIGPSFWIENAKSSGRGLGATAVAGFSVPWKRWIVAPQMNYTRWATFDWPGISRNQVQLMLAFTF